MFFMKISGKNFEIRTQLMINTIYVKGEPTRFFYDFRDKLMVFKALINCFRKSYMEGLFCFNFLYFLWPNDLVYPIRDLISFQKL